MRFTLDYFQKGCKPDTCQPRVERSGALGFQPEVCQPRENAVSPRVPKGL